MRGNKPCHIRRLVCPLCLLCLLQPLVPDLLKVTFPAVGLQVVAKDKKAILAALQNGTLGVYKYADPELKKDKERVLAAVRQAGPSAANTELKKDLALAAIPSMYWHSSFPECVDAGLTSDKEIALVDIPCGHTPYIDSELNRDKEVILANIRQN